MRFCNFINLIDYYPEYEPAYNSEGKICPDDYVYGYSLFLFFSCVTHREEKMQTACRTMQEETQLVIKTFLQNLLDCNSFSREAIKDVIESSGVCSTICPSCYMYIFLQYIEFHFTAPAKMSDYVLVLSPNKSNEVNICPPTPRTKILNEWNSENRQLKVILKLKRKSKENSVRQFN